jgi:hypothetical protein
MMARLDSPGPAGRVWQVGGPSIAVGRLNALAKPAKGKAAIAMAAAFIACLPAAAAEGPQPWRCARAAELPSLTLNKGPLVLNNFNLHEETGMFSRRPYIELSFSAVNRSDDPYFLTVQFLAFDDERPLFAISAEPTLGIVSDHTADQVTASVNALPGELRRMTLFCTRADGDFE